MKMKKIALIMAVLCLLLSLAACSEDAVPENDVCSDIQALFLEDYSNIDFDDVSVEIDRRQTNEDDKTDYVWAFVSASNDDLQFNGAYYAEYVLYNEGWLLQEHRMESGELSLRRSTVTESQAETAVRSENLPDYDGLTLTDRITDLNYGEDLFYFEGQYTEGYLSAVDMIEVRYCYTLSGGWDLESVDCISTTETWDVLGKWEYHADGESMWLYIHEINDDTITVEFDFDYTWEYDSAWYGLTREDQHFISSGIETRQLSATENGTSFNLMTNMPSTPYVYISKTQGVTFDGYWSNPDDSYILTYTGK